MSIMFHRRNFDSVLVNIKYLDIKVIKEIQLDLEITCVLLATLIPVVGLDLITSEGT